MFGEMSGTSLASWTPLFNSVEYSVLMISISLTSILRNHCIAIILNTIQTKFILKRRNVFVHNCSINLFVDPIVTIVLFNGPVNLNFSLTWKHTEEMGK